MEYIAKQREETAMVQPINPVYVELSVIEIVKDRNGNDVEILKSIGTFSVTDLEREKENLLKHVIEIDARIAAINTLNK